MLECVNKTFLEIVESWMWWCMPVIPALRRLRQD
jgi:hypothetical protein